jgi:hypothetical protein
MTLDWQILDSSLTILFFLWHVLRYVLSRTSSRAQRKDYQAGKKNWIPGSQSNFLHINVNMISYTMIIILLIAGNKRRHLDMKNLQTQKKTICLHFLFTQSFFNTCLAAIVE